MNIRSTIDYSKPRTYAEHNRVAMTPASATAPVAVMNDDPLAIEIRAALDARRLRISNGEQS